MVQLASSTAGGGPESLVVDASHIADVVAQWTGVPVQQLSGEETTTLLNIEGALSVGPGRCWYRLPRHRMSITSRIEGYARVHHAVNTGAG